MVRSLAALLLLAASAPAAAGAPRRYALREIRVEGAADAAEEARLRERLFTTVELLVSQEGGALAPADEVARALDERPEWRDCREKWCALALGDRLGAARLMSIIAERAGAGWELRVLDFAVDSTHIVATRELACGGCGVDALVGEFSRMLPALLAADAPAPLCRLKVASAPAQAALFVDTARLGSTPFEHTIAAGRHTVGVERERCARGQVEIDCPAGGGQDIAFTLTVERASAVWRATPPAVPASRRAWWRGLGFASAGLGVAALAGLGVEASRDGRAVAGGERLDATRGIALAAVGGALFLGGAAALLYFGFRAPARIAGAGVAF